MVLSDATRLRVGREDWLREVVSARLNPEEMNNLANDTDHQETMAELRARLEQLAVRYSASRNTASETDKN